MHENDIRQLNQKVNLCCYTVIAGNFRYLFSRHGAALLLLKYKIVQCEISHISRNYFQRRPKFCCSADFRLSAFFSGGFSASDYFSANSAEIRLLGVYRGVV